MDFNLTAAVQPPTVRLTALGELDIFSARQMTRTLGAALDVGCDAVLVDVAGVTFVDASALGVLARTYGTLTAAHASIEFVAVSPSFHRLCAMTGLDTVLTPN